MRILQTTRLIFAVMVAAMLGGCITTNNVEKSSHPMSVSQARTLLKTMQGNYCGSDRMDCGAAAYYRVEIHSEELVLVRKSDNNSLHFRFDRMPAPQTAHAVGIPFWFLSVGPDQWFLLVMARPEEMMRSYADALMVVWQAARPDAKAAEQAKFEGAVQSYREATIKPVPGEGVRRFQIRAEVAVREKRFEDAADAYGEGLDIAPWWPEGHFNRALVLAETGDYALAVTEMKRYLDLAPNAPDARAAQDKIYEWEPKAGK